MNENINTAIDLAAYQWKNRLLILFAPTEDDAKYVNQWRVLQERESGLTDRDMVIVHVFESGARIGAQEYAANQAEALWQDYRLSTDATVAVLIGKDGGEKWRRPMPINIDEMFAIIDAMPMRQNEMRDQ